MPKVLTLSDSGRPCGESAAGAHWSDATVEAVRAAVAAGVPLAIAAARFGVPRRTARDWCSGRCRGLPVAWAVRRGGRLVRIA